MSAMWEAKLHKDGEVVDRVFFKSIHWGKHHLTHPNRLQSTREWPDVIEAQVTHWAHGSTRIVGPGYVITIDRQEMLG